MISTREMLIEVKNVIERQLDGALEYDRCDELDGLRDKVIAFLDEMDPQPDHKYEPRSLEARRYHCLVMGQDGSLYNPSDI